MRGTSPKIASMADWFLEWSIDAFIASVALYLVFVAALFS
jgi:glycogen debranching enzyme